MIYTVLKRRRGQVIPRPVGTAKSVAQIKKLLGIAHIDERSINTDAPIISINGADYYAFDSNATAY